jgi:protein O-GlcNAc transferase
MKLADLAREAFNRYSRGDFKGAERAARKALALAPRDPNLLQLLAAALVGQGRATEAVNLLEKAINTSLATGELLYNLGTALAAAGRHKEAVQRLKQASIAKPRDPDCHNNLGLALLFTNQYADAEVAFGRALKLRPDWPPALHNLGRAVAAQGRHQEALNSYSRAIGIGKRAPAELMVDMGISFRDLGRHSEALASYERALALEPDLAEAYYSRGNALFNLQRHSEALASYDRALVLKPDVAEAHYNRGIALYNLKRFAEALASYDRALALEPGLPEIHHGRGNALNALHRLDESLASYGRSIATNPENLKSLADYVQVASLMCDWTAAARDKIDLLIGCKKPTFEPMITLAISDDPAVQRAVAEVFVRNRTTPDIRPVQPSGSATPRKLRLGYLSADFKQHPVGVLMAELVELHDRSRFDVVGFSAGPDDQSAVHQRIKNAFDVFVDVRGMSDASLRQAIQVAQIDIIVDLGGHTTDGRIFALAHRPAPIQATYLGYPGTTGAPFIDYAIVDRFVVPDGTSRFFTEKLAYLPHCYLVSDSKRPIAQRNPSRAEFGLADGAFAFCCFNSPRKINAPVFDVWMRALAAVPGSVLWLVQNNEWATENLRKEAQMRGVDPARLVFAPHLSYADHLAALCLADLFLDTWPYNAHTTASDALWVGLPVLTYSGRSFAGRVAGSLLHAIGIPELITYAVDDYEALAIRLAHGPDILKELRQRLAANVKTAPLFQTDRFSRDIETAFTQMWERYRRGEAPESFAVQTSQ